MKSIARYTLINLLLMIMTTVVNAETDANSGIPNLEPVALVATLYTQSQKTDNAMFFDENGLELLKQYFTENLAELVIADLKATQPGDSGRLGFDPLYAAQDFEVTNFALRLDAVENSQAKVIATIKNFGETVEVIFSLQQRVGQWRIVNIEYHEHEDLLTILTQSK